MRYTACAVVWQVIPSREEVATPLYNTNLTKYTFNMKLHLPKGLFVAVLAAAVISPACAGADEWSTDFGGTFYIRNEGKQTIDATGQTYTDWQIWSDTGAADNKSTNTTVEILKFKDGDTAAVELGTWGNSRSFDTLTLSDISIWKDGVAAEDATATLRIDKDQKVSIGTVSNGKLSTIVNGTLSVTGTANFGSVTFGGDTIANTGTINISDALTIGNISSAKQIGTYTDSNGNGYFIGSYVLVEGGSVSVAQSILDADNKLNWDAEAKLLTYSTGEQGTIYYLSTKEVTYEGSESWASTTGFNIGAQGVLKLNTNLADTMTDGITISKSGATIEINNGVTLSLSKVTALKGQQADYVVEGGSELQIGDGTRTDINSITVNGNGLLHFDKAASSIGTADDHVNVVLNDNATLQLRNGNGSSAPIYADFAINAGEGGVNMLGSWNGNNTKLAGTLTGKGTLNLGQESGKTNTWTISGVISDKSATETLSISSNSGVTLSGTNTYSGGTTITGNTLVADNARALGNGLVTMKGGHLQLKQDLTVNSIKMESGSSIINLNAKKLTVTNDVTAGHATDHKMRVSGATNSTLTFNGNLALICNLDVEADADVTLELNGADNKVRVFDFTGKATVKLAADSVLETSNAKDTGSMSNGGAQTLWMTVGSSIQLGSKAQFKSHGALVTGKGEGSAISLDGTSRRNVSIWSGGKYEKVDIEAKTIYDNGNVTSWLVDSTLKNSTGSTIVASNKGNTLTAVDAATGSINLQNVLEHNLTSLSIGERLIVSAHTGDQALESTENEATITVSNTATFGAGATLNANLVLESGSSLTLDGALTMGCTLTLNSGITLDSATLTSITGMADDATVTLFKGVDALTVNGTGFTTLSETEQYTLDQVFTGEGLEGFYLGFAEGNVYAGKIVASTPAVPEPATATLSLLALCGLAARRRRK